jgi:NADH-quinone oxidoreductase subunit H
MRFVGPAVLFAKIMFVAFLMFWVRFTYPRLREDQLQALAWKVLIPIGLLNIVATAILKVAM